jgi:hypothetical protein
MQPTPFFTVAIPTFNRAERLRACLQSLTAQSFSDFEIIVVDNASPDETEATVRSLGDPRIRYIRHKENIGPFRNLIFSSTTGTGEFLVIHQDDDWLHRDFLARCHACVSRDDSVAVYGAATLAGEPRSGYSGRVEPDFSGQARGDYALRDEPVVAHGASLAVRYLVSHFINHPAIAFRRQTLAAVGGYCSEPGCYGDLVTIPTVMSAGRVAYDPRFGGAATVHAQQVSRNVGKRERADLTRRTFQLQIEALNRRVPDWPERLRTELGNLPLVTHLHLLKDAVGFNAPTEFIRQLWHPLIGSGQGRGKLLRKTCSRIGIRNTLRLLWRAGWRAPIIQ